MTFVTAVDHPLVTHHLARLRDASTPPTEFRALVQRLAVLLAYEATKDLRLTEVEVQTPLTKTTGRVLQQRIGVVPILRAGLGMVNPVLDLIPDAEVWHLGLYRDEVTAQPVEYYSKLPSAGPVDIALVLDPMLATGGSAVATLDILKKAGVPHIKYMGVIGAPEGVEKLTKAHPDVPIHLAAIDERLNDVGFIVPGLGDAGDRQYGT